MKKTLLFFLLFNSLFVFPQTIKTAYEEKILPREGSYEDLEPFIKKILIENDKKTIIYNYKLTHHQGKSNYKIANDIPEKDVQIDGEVTYTTINEGPKNYIMYKDQDQKKMVNHTSFFGREFLIKDNLQNFEWVLTDEKKRIGQYECTKAIAELGSVYAWYAEELPINDGPREYWGLPGLILLVEFLKDNKLTRTITATEVAFIDAQVELTPPTKGKVITKATYDKIVQGKVDAASSPPNFDEN